MEIAGTLINAAVVAVVGLFVAWLGKGKFEALERRMDRLQHRVDDRFGRLEGQLGQSVGRLDHRIDVLQSSVDAMRSDLTQVALAVGVRPRAENA